jgi:exopolyphosphatase/guanosine-5'-triphosphate,3'-diphosphate pyrophosphatase
VIEELGEIPESKLVETAGWVAGFAAVARTHGAERLEVLVTSPGRQAANGGELVKCLEAAARAPVHLLSAAEEGRLAFIGAISTTRSLSDKVVAVCDVGGGSAQIAVGRGREGAVGARSLDIGSMRLTTWLLPGYPPGEAAVRSARTEVARYLEGIVPPAPHVALAVGGSARALRSLVGPTLDRSALGEGLTILAATRADELVARYDLDRERLRTLAGGAVILDAIRQRLGVPLKVGRGGIREGAALELAAERAAA